MSVPRQIGVWQGGGGLSRILVLLRGGQQARLSRSPRSARPRHGPFRESCCPRDLTRGQAASAVRTRDRPAGAGQAKPHWGPELRGLRRGWFPQGSPADARQAEPRRVGWQSSWGAGGGGAAPASAATSLPGPSGSLVGGVEEVHLTGVSTGFLGSRQVPPRAVA